MANDQAAIDQRHLALEDTRRALASLDNRLDWLARYVAEADELKAERARLVKQERKLSRPA